MSERTMQRDPLVVIAGPTGVGKSELAIRLAEQIGAEVISADSMQVYRGMDIGSAKVTAEEQRGIPHHLIDVLDPEEPFDVVRFQQMAKEAISAIRANGHIPILCGGTGFYIQAVLYDIRFEEEDALKGDDGFRKVLEARAAAGEGAALHRELSLADPDAAKAIHPNNLKRVIRALEYYHQTGRRISEHNAEEAARPSPYRYVYFALSDHREEIYRRIDLRVDEMMERGLLKEVRALRERGYTREMVSMQGLGYQQLLAFLDGELSLEDAVFQIKRDTRRYAKRQLTWLRRERQVTWINRYEYAQEQEMLTRMLELLREAGII